MEYLPSAHNPYNMTFNLIIWPSDGPWPSDQWDHVTQLEQQQQRRMCEQHQGTHGQTLVENDQKSKSLKMMEEDTPMYFNYAGPRIINVQGPMVKQMHENDQNF